VLTNYFADSILLEMNVFISYTFEDSKWAQEIVSNPKRKGLDVWDASSQLSPGDNWALEVGKALERAKAMVILLSPAAAECENLRRELEYALTSEKFRNRLIPVIVKPTRKVPWILERLNPEKGSPSEVSQRIVQRLKDSEAAAN
jgi:hypothetical protein